MTNMPSRLLSVFIFFFFQAEDGIRDLTVTGVQTCALPICVQKFDSAAISLASVSGGGANRSVAVLDHWTPQNPSNTVPRAIVGDPNQNDQIGRASCRDRV